MNENLPMPSDQQPIVPRQADTDAQLAELWLHGRSRHTQRYYRSDLTEFLTFVNKPLHAVTLGDIQAFAEKLKGDALVQGSQNRKLASVKSAFAFAHRIGYLPFDVSRPVRIQAARDTLTERILTETEIQTMIALEKNPRNKALLLCLYGSGVRVSELCDLRWKDLCPREEAGQVTVLGKGRKTRAILLPESVWTAMTRLRGDEADEQPVFKSRKKRPLSPVQVWRIVRKAAVRAGIEKPVCPHFYRHAHASHSLDRGCPLHVTQATLGHSSISTTSRYLHARPKDSSGKYLPL